MARIRKTRMPSIGTVIGPDTRIDGSLRFAGGLHLDGVVHGDVSGLPDGQATLVVSRSGRVEGDVTVENLILDGTIIGDVDASNRVELASGARVKGTVHYQLLEMAMGAEVNGQLIHHQEVQEPAQAEAPLETESSADPAE